MGCGASAPIKEEKSPLDVDRTPSARLRVERSMSASVRGETVVVLEGYEFEGTLGYGAFVRGDGKEESPQLEKAPSETISELATLQSENATPPPA